MKSRHTRLAAALVSVGALTTGMTGHAAVSALEMWGDVDILAISGDGNVVGYTDSGTGYGYVQNIALGTSSRLSLSGLYGTDEVRGLSNDGSVAAGVAYGWDGGGNYISSAFKWTPTGTPYKQVALAGLASGQNSAAEAVSGDGRVIVGAAAIADGTLHAVSWSGTDHATVTDLGGGGFTAYSRALGASNDGGVIVGYGMNAGNAAEAFRWTSAGGMAGLGFLSGKTGSEATDVSGDGAVVVGNSYTFGAPTDVLAFRWTSAGGMQSLGLLAGATQARASAVTADGAVVVGHVTSADSQNTAFRWTQATSMQSVADWLVASGVDTTNWTFDTANDVSDDGNTVVGEATVNGNNQAYIARGASGSGGSGGGGGGGSVIGVEDFTATLAGVAGSLSVGGEFAGMTLFGAHHRTLADNGLLSGRCMWATGDLGGSSDGRQWLGEVGACADLGPWRLGAGLGASAIRHDLTLGGRAEYDGRHLYAEADYRFGDHLLGSLSGFHGDWDADLRRNYMNGATLETASGATDVRAWALRLRLDWLDVASVGAFSLSPFAAYSHGRSHADGYAETGTAAVTYGDYDRTDREFRLGLGGRSMLSADTDLRLTAEAIHRFGNDATLHASGALDTDVSAPDYDRNRIRLGAEIDHRIGKDALLSASLHASSGDAATWLGSVSWKTRF